MMISRRRFALGCSATAVSTLIDLSKPALAASQRLSTQGRYGSILRNAERLQLIEPGIGRAEQGISTVDLATVVLNGLEKPQAGNEVRALVEQTASFLSALTQSQREARAESEIRRAHQFADLRRDYHDKFVGCNLQPQHKPEIDKAITFILSPAAKKRYQDVANDPKNTGAVPWYVIAALHFREASLNFLGHVHNGDSLNRLTTDVPAGRPKVRPWPPSPWDPVSAWKISALDALTDLPIMTCWTIEQMLWGFENYNGMGCRDHGIASPYLWSYSQYYRMGGYYSDNKYSSTWVSKQAGLGLLIKSLSERSDEVKIEFEPS